MSISACILSVSGPELRSDECAFLRDANPWGLILMGRSCQSPEQIHRLCGDIREALGRDALIFIDQEGGRVARLRPPVCPEYPPAAIYGRYYETNPILSRRACLLGHQLIGLDLSGLGITANCAPCCDLYQPDTHEAIGDRAFSHLPGAVMDLAAAALEGLRKGGVWGCVKHMPGQGRATSDSHYDLPSIQASGSELETDFSIFRALADQAVMGMTGHIVLEEFDPDRPATVSKTIIQEVIRGRIGFDGLLMTDDLGMNALGGTLHARGQQALQAGCDLLLHCSGFLRDPQDILKEMAEVASAAGALEGEAMRRAEQVTGAQRQASHADLSGLREEYQALMSGLAKEGG